MIGTHCMIMEDSKITDLHDMLDLAWAYRGQDMAEKITPALNLTRASLPPMNS
jgi:hypothetical protein